MISLLVLVSIVLLLFCVTQNSNHLHRRCSHFLHICFDYIGEREREREREKALSANKNERTISRFTESKEGIFKVQQIKVCVDN